MYAQLTGVWRDGPLAAGVPTRTALHLEIPRGTTAEVVLRVVRASGEPLVLDLSGGDSIVLSIGVGVVKEPLRRIFATVDPDDASLYRFAISSSETEDLPRRLTWDVRATRGATDSDTRQVVEPGVLVIGEAFSS